MTGYRCGDVLTHDFRDIEFDVIVATCIFVPILDLEALIKRTGMLLRPQGHLVVLSPHEKWHYRLARRIFGYQKPHDHYHLSDDITRKVSQGLTHLCSAYYPWGIRLYKIDVFCGKASQ